MAARRVICTHSGPFHCDDVLACCMVKFLPTYKDAQIVRSRDQKVIDKADIVLDVGGEYDFEKLRFDHHQRTFNLTLKDLNPKLDHTIKLSSAGLVYHHFGKDVLVEVLKSLGSEQNDEEKLTIFYEQIYRKFVKEIDGIDNGITIAENPKYEIHTGISSRISRFNLDWNDDQTDENVLQRFLQAIDYIRDEFVSIIRQLNNVWWPVRDMVKKAIEGRFGVDASGAIVEFTSEIVPPYLKHLFMLEKQLQIEGQIKYAVFRDKNVYRVRAIPIHDESFVLRKPLLEQWRGLRDQELCDLAGLSDCVFVHSTGFIGGAGSRESALEMARRSLAADEPNGNAENGQKKQKLS